MNGTDRGMVDIRCDSCNIPPRLYMVKYLLKRQEHINTIDIPEMFIFFLESTQVDPYPFYETLTGCFEHCFSFLQWKVNYYRCITDDKIPANNGIRFYR